MLYPITVEVLHQVFFPHGYVKKVVIFQKSARVQVLVQFQSRQNAIAARNSLQGRNIYKADNTKPPLSTDTFGNNEGDDSKISGPVTLAEEVMDSRHCSTFFSLVEHISPQVLQLWEIIGISDVHELMDNFVQLNAMEWMRLQAMVTAGVGRRKRLKCYIQGSGRRKKKKGLIVAAEDDTELFLEPQYSPPLILVPVLFLIEDHGIPESRYFLDISLRTRQENEELNKKQNKQENIKVGVKTYANVTIIAECDKQLNTIHTEIDSNGNEVGVFVEVDEVSFYTLL
nr:polypyrimidine tract-binding protein homolog 3 [Tanacetum cinerariifolium]GEZ06515.1 polypyrimidine tract-binding protein homolog 3 [Tanacetum cinerariifolium]